MDGSTLDLFGSTGSSSFTDVAVATVTDSDGSAASDFAGSTINWGDGTTDTVGSVVDNGDGTFTFHGTHTYATRGRYPLTVDGIDNDGISNDAESTITGGDAFIAAVGEEQLGAAPAPAAFVPRDTGTLNLGSSTGDSDSSLITDYIATIDWGDGSTSTGTLADNLGSGSVGVSGSHLYTVDGVYKVVVDVQDADAGNLDSEAWIVDKVVATNKVVWSLNDLSNTATSNPPGLPGALEPGSGSPASDGSSVAPVSNNPASMDFSGSNDVSVPDAAWLDLPQGTLDTWVNFAQKPSVAGHPMNIVSKSNQYWLHATTLAENGDADGDVGPDALEAKVVVGGVRYVAATAANFIHAGEWYHVTATYDSTAHALKLYVNGVLEHANTSPASAPIDATGNPFDFGTWSASPGADSFVGSLDEVTLYRDVLSGADVQALPQPVPVAHDFAVTTNEDTAKVVTLNGTQSGGGPLTYKITSLPAHGTLKDGATAIGAAPFTLSGNTVTYTPAANYNNADSGVSGSPDTFQYKVNDDVQQSTAGTVSVTVLSVADQTTTAYTGQSQGSTAKPGKLNVGGSITSTDPLCVANQTIYFLLNKNPTISNSTTAFNLGNAPTGVATGPTSGLWSGSASIPPVSIGNWLPGNYTITAQYQGRDSTAGGVHTVCGGSQAGKALTIKKK